MKTRAHQILTVILSTLFFSMGFVGSLKANPEGGAVVSGQATIQQSPGYTQINQSTDKAIINWQSFNIGEGEHTHFQQPGSNSITLNRVIGGDPSRIFGKLTANGRIILLNQAGIFFGPNSRVDVAGIIASTAKMTDNDFLSGNYRFTQDPNRNAGIVNYGTINAADRGLVALVAPGVENNGVIRANLGKVALASGTEYTIDFYGDETIQFATGTKVSQTPVDADGNPMKAGVSNKGKIYADGGQVLLSARIAEGIVENSINMDGVIQAKSISQQNGKIVLDGGDDGTTRVSGQIDVSGLNDGETGGTAKVLGKYVALTDNAEINASGKKGGGTILVGGNYQGKGPERNSKATFVGANTKVKADAIDDGNGGKIIIWSDGTTRFYGTLTARGGINGGDGGFAEISGKGWLDFQPTDISLKTYHGQRGNLLLDPTNITICHQGDTGCTNNANIQTYDPSDGIGIEPGGSSQTSTIMDSYINAFLADGDVTIRTTSGQSQDGDITILSGTTLGTSNISSLILEADGSITIGSGAVLSGLTSFLFYANNSNTTTNSITLYGTINNSPASVAFENLGTGNLTINIDSASTINTNIIIVDTNTTLNLNADIQAVTFSGAATTTNVSTTGKISDAIALTVADGTGIVNLANGTYNEAVTLNRNVILAGPSTSGQAATINSFTQTVGGAGIKGNLVMASGDFNVNGNVLELAGNTSITTNTGAINLATAVTGDYGLTLTTTSGDITIGTVNDINSLTVTNTSGNTYLTNNINFTTGDIVFNAPVTLNANITFDNGGSGGDVTFNDSISGPSYKITSAVLGGGIVTFANGADISDFTGSVGNILQLAGTLNINKTDNTTFNPIGSMILGGDSTITIACTNSCTSGMTLNAINGNYQLTLNPKNTMRFSGVVNIGGVEINNASGTTIFGNIFTANTGDIVVNTANIRTDGNRALTAAGDITFNGDVNGSSSGMTLSAGGLITLNDVTVSDAFTTTGSGSTLLKGDVLVEDQGQNAVFNTPTVTVSPTASDNTLTITAHDITIGGTLSGIGLLTLNSSANGGDAGVTSIAGGTIGGITTNSEGTTSITGNLTATSGDLTFNDQVVINSSGTITLDANSYNIQFNNATSALSGTAVVVLNSSGNTAFASAITIGGLTTDSGGTTTLGYNVTSTADDIIFNDDVTINSPITINAGSNAIAFNGSATANNLELILNAAESVTLTDVTVQTLTLTTTPGTIYLNKALTITENTGLTFDSPVVLLGNASVNKSTNPITFNKTISGNYTLTLNSTDVTRINDTVNVGGMVTNSGGTTEIYTNSLTANNSGFTFNDPVTTHQDTTFTSNNSGITFNDILDGAYQFTLTANNGDITFADIVGNTQAIISMLIGNANNVTAVNQLNTGSFTQTAGRGTTDFQTGLYASGDVNINTNKIKGNINAQNTILYGLNNIAVNVIVSTLTLGGQSGGYANGTVGGYGDELAALLTRLTGDAAGNFIVNGCLLPGGCLADTDAAEMAEATTQDLPPVDEPVCTMRANSNNPDGAKACAGTLEIKKEELVSAQ